MDIGLEIGTGPTDEKKTRIWYGNGISICSTLQIYDVKWHLISVINCKII